MQWRAFRMLNCLHTHLALRPGALRHASLQRLQLLGQCGRQQAHSSAQAPRLAARAAAATQEVVEGAAAAGSGDQQQRRASRAGPPAEQQRRGLIDVQPPRGTRDFPPEEMRLRNWLFGHFREAARLSGFEEVDAPVLESEELFIRKAGEEISGQLYAFEDKGGRRMALRPEFTPSLARLLLAKGKGLALPAKWFTVAQCWRYERATRGRRREHYQWNMDVVGVTGPAAEAELLAAMTGLLQRLGLSAQDVVIRVNSRKVLQEVLQRFGVADESFAPVCVVLDKSEKLPREEVEKQLADLGVEQAAAGGILGAMALGSLDELEALLGAGSAPLAELRQLFDLAAAYGYADWLRLDCSVVRGLAYYTGIVFEAFDRQGALRAVAGGGRYDRLLETFGGEPQPCAGFGFGDAVIVELLKERGLLPSPQQQVDALVVATEEEVRPQAVAIAARARRAGRSVDLVLEPKRLKWVFKQAERVGAARLVLVGGQEASAGLVRVKDQASRAQVDVPLAGGALEAALDPAQPLPGQPEAPAA